MESNFHLTEKAAYESRLFITLAIAFPEINHPLSNSELHYKNLC